MISPKKLVSISLLVFGAAVVYILAAGLVFDRGSGSTSAPGTPADSATGQPGQTGGTTISVQEVAKHSSSGDCWIIVSSKVYNVSGYLKSHPGGTGTIAPYCGKEATHAFETKDFGGGGQNHSNGAWNHLDSLYVGDLGG